MVRRDADGLSHNRYACRASACRAGVRQGESGVAIDQLSGSDEMLADDVGRRLRQRAEFGPDIAIKPGDIGVVRRRWKVAIRSPHECGRFARVAFGTLPSLPITRGRGAAALIMPARSGRSPVFATTCTVTGTRTPFTSTRTTLTRTGTTLTRARPALTRTRATVSRAGTTLARARTRFTRARPTLGCAGTTFTATRTTLTCSAGA